MLIIRKLEKDDSLEALVELSRQFFAEYEAYHDDFFKIEDLREVYILDYFARFLNGKSRAAYIAIVDRKIVGYITVYIKQQGYFWKFKHVGDISGLMVHKDYRRSGIGRQLVNMAHNFFEERGVKYYTVSTASTNQSALEFYAKYGMTPLNTKLVGQTHNE